MGNSKSPYALPETLKCDPAEIKNGVSIELVHKYIERHEELLPRYAYLKAMYDGFHGIFDLPAKDDWKPDNRLAVGFPEYLVTTFEGYAYGIPPKIIHPDEGINENIQAFLKAVHFDDFFKELTTLGSEFGHAWAYLYQDEETKTKIKYFDPTQLFCVYDDTLEGRALFAVRYGRHGEESKNKDKLYGEVLTPTEIKLFEDKEYTETDVNPYGMIPVVECRLNERRKSLFESVCGMTELYDKAISEKGNDVDAFAEAYLAIIGVEVKEDGYREIRDKRFINIFGTRSAEEVKDSIIQFLQKPTADATQENLLDRLERLIFQISMVANISDESFSNAASGEALAYKLWNTSNLGNTYDLKNVKTLEKIFKLWCSLSTNCPNKDAWQEIEVQMTRNLPKNLKSEAETAQALDGIVSRETQLRVLSIVDDPQVEKEKMKAEDEANISSSVADNMFNGGEDKLNGAQISSLVGIVEQYSAGVLSEGQAAALITKGVNVEPDEARRILKGML